MYCPKCGNYINGEAAFCPQCGNRLYSQYHMSPFYNHQPYQSQINSNGQENGEYAVSKDNIAVFVILIIANAVMSINPFVTIFNGEGAGGAKGASLYSLKRESINLGFYSYSMPETLSGNADLLRSILCILSLVIICMTVLAIISITKDPTTYLIISSLTSVIQLLGAIILKSLAEKQGGSISFTPLYELLLGLSINLLVIGIVMKIVIKKKKQ